VGSTHAVKSHNNITGDIIEIEVTE